MLKKSSLFAVLTALVLMLGCLSACGIFCDHTLVFREAVEAQCEKDGVAAHYECTKCGELFADENATQKLSKDSLTVKALGHAWTGSPCEGQTCSRCGSTSAAAGHALEGVTWTDNGDLHRIEEGKCDFEGTHTAACPVCGKQVTEPYTVKDRHTYITRIGRRATCVLEGTLETVCSVCGDVAMATPYADASAHDWVEGERDGIITNYVCRNDERHVLRAIVSDMGASDFTKEELGRADEVAVSDVRIAFDPTAQAAFPDGSLTLSVEVVAQEEIPQSVKEKLTGDVYNITMMGTDGAITAFGGGKATVRLPYTPKAGENLSSLIVYYIDGETLQPISAAYAGGYVVFETAHFSQFAVGMYKGEDACEELGHVTVEIRTEPSCTEAGKLEEICTRCGKTLSSTQLEPLGHSAGSLSIQPPTCLEDGVKESRCTCCGEVIESVPIPARGHHAYDGEGKCLDCGYQCPHTQRDPDGACLECHSGCAHEFEDGTCAKCGYRCPHKWSFGEEGGTEARCDLCGMVCRHENANSCLCPTCGYTYGEHKYLSDGKCLFCGTECKHKFVSEWNGAGSICPECRFVCPHTQFSYEYYMLEGEKVYKDDPEEGHFCLTCGGDVGRLAHHFAGGVCSDCGYACVHEYVTKPVGDESECTYCIKCGMGCEHVSHGSDGVCTVCETRVGHTMSEDGACGVCHLKCSHRLHDGLGFCQECGTYVGHEYEEYPYDKSMRCTRCGSTCYHVADDFRNDRNCSLCGASCPHYMDENDTCILCNFRCTHETWEYGQCKTCGKTCPHGSHTQDAKCTVCGSQLWHGPYENGQCTVCGKACEHDWSVTGVCRTCGMACTHDFGTDNYCHTCGKAKDHEHAFDPMTATCFECGYTCRHEWNSEDGICTVCSMRCTHEWQYNAPEPGMPYTSTCEICAKVCLHGDGFYHSFTEGRCEDCGWECAHLYGSDGMDPYLDDYTYHTCKLCMQRSEHRWADDEEGGKVCEQCRVHCDHGVPYPRDTYNSKFRGGVCSVCGFECRHDECELNGNVFYGWFCDDPSYSSTHRCDRCGMEAEHVWTCNEGDHYCALCGMPPETHNFSMGTGECSRCGYRCKHQNVENGFCNDCGMQFSAMGIGLCAELPKKREEV